MARISRIVLRWLPALMVMLVIFIISSRSASELPSFDWADRVVKKGGHVFGYALLAISCWRAFYFRPERRWLAWGLALFYAVTDEFHQSFVPGRYPSVGDILIFDNLGALLGLLLLSLYKTQRSDPGRPIAGNVNAKG